MLHPVLVLIVLGCICGSLAYSQPQITVTPTSLDFGIEKPGVPGAARQFAVRNTGTAPLAIAGITSNNGEFSIVDNLCSGGPGPNTSCHFTVVFTPSTTGARSGQITIMSNASNASPCMPAVSGQLCTIVALSGTGGDPVKSISITPSSITFAPQNVGTQSAPQTITLRSTGSSAIAISRIVLNSPSFTVTDNCPASLPSGASCTASIVFAPKAAGVTTGGALQIFTDASGGFFLARLFGVAVDPGANVRVDRPSLNFTYDPGPGGGAVPAPQAVTLTATVTPLTYVVNNPCSWLSVSPLSGSAPATLTFAPTEAGLKNLTASQVSCVFSISTTPASTAPVAVFVQVKLTSVSSRIISVTPSSIDFGVQPPGVTAAARRIAIRSAGNAQLAINSITSNSGEFAVIDSLCATARPGTQCHFSIAFTPSAAGVRNGQVTIASDAHNAPQLILPLTGTGGAAAKSISIAPSSLRFPTLIAGSRSTPLTVTIVNRGSAALAISRIVSNSTTFPLTNNTCPASLPSGASCTASAVFAPPVAGSHTGGALQIFSDAPGGGPHLVPMIGTATPSVSIKTTTLPSAALSSAYSTQLTAAGGTPPYNSWTVSSGALPTGVTLNAVTGQISGTPGTLTGSPFGFSVTVRDSAGVTSPPQPLSVAVSPGSGCNATLARDSVTVPSAAGSQPTVAYTLPAGCTATAASSASWLTVPPAQTPGTLSYSVGMNTSSSGRTAVITLAGATYTVTQSGQTCSYSLTPGSSTVTPVQQTGTVSISAPAGCPWQVISDVSWLRFQGNGTGSGSGDIAYSIDENRLVDARTGKLTVGSGTSTPSTFTVVQTGWAQEAKCAGSATPLSIRRNGIAEKTGDVTLTCTGIPAGGVRADIRVSLSSTVTSRRTAASGFITEALAILNNAASPVLGSTSWQGELSGPNGLLWKNVNISPDPQGGATLRLTNIRVAAPQDPPDVKARVETSGSMIALSNTSLTIATTVDAMTVTQGSVTAGPGNRSTVAITFREQVDGVFRTQAQESGFSAAGGTLPSGQANTGTRLRIRLAVPAGVRVYVPVSAGSARLVNADVNGAGGSREPVDGVKELIATGGVATATWEIETPSTALDTVTIPLQIEAATLAQVTAIAASVTAGLAPFATALTSTPDTPAPRFLDTGTYVPRVDLRLVLRSPFSASASLPRLSKDDRRFQVAGNLSFNYDFQNQGSVPATTTEVHSRAPEGFEFDEDTTTGTRNPAIVFSPDRTEVTMTYARVDPGTTESVHLELTGAGVGGTYLEAVTTLESLEPDLDVTNNRDSTGFIAAGCPQNTLTPVAASSPAAGGEGQFNIGSTCSFWQITSNVPWITSITPTFGVGTMDVKYTVIPNPTGNQRVGTITAGGQTFTVTQQGLVGAGAISGQITKAGVALPGVLVTLSGFSSATTTTAANGTYNFNSLAAGDYTVTPSLANHRFTPPTMNFTNLQTMQTANFTAEALTSTTSNRFVPVTPCRIADTRDPNGPFGGPAIAGGTLRSFAVPASPCGIPASATAYSINVTVVPRGLLGFLTVWPAGLPQPVASTLNSFDGRIKANAAIVPAGTGGAISVFAMHTTDVILDINGYFVPAGAASSLTFYPLAPCRIADTRNGPGPLGGPSLSASQQRSFPVRSSNCAVPATAQAYSLNFTAIPKGFLGHMTAWPTGVAAPLASTLNAPTGQITANAAVIPAGTNGDVSVFVTNEADIVIDINGYFAPPGTGGLSLYSLTPCRVLDTREPAGSAAFKNARNTNVTASSCSVSANAQAYIFNATVVPSGLMGFLTLWPQGQAQPLVSTLNALDGFITSNLAIVPTTNGSVSSFAMHDTHLLLDILGYFAP